jgi:hypothetical protein
MLRFSLLFVLFFPAILSCQAQPIFRVKAGFNLAKMSRYPKQKVRNEILHDGMHAGVQLQYTLSSNWRVESELAIDQKGAESLWSGFNSPGHSVGLTTIELPVLITRRLTSRVGISAGLASSYLLHARFKASNDEKQNVTRYYKKIDVTSLLNLSYDVVDFEFGARLGYGLIKTNEKHILADVERMQIKEILPFGRNKVVNFYISYKL